MADCDLDAAKLPFQWSQVRTAAQAGKLTFVA
jgi:hypothetical protein